MRTQAMEFSLVVVVVVVVVVVTLVVINDSSSRGDDATKQFHHSGVNRVTNRTVTEVKKERER
jgi:preprotein translocase subunit SecG